MLSLIPFTALIISLLFVKAEVTYSYHECSAVSIEISVVEISLSNFKRNDKKRRGSKLSGFRSLKRAFEYLLPKSDVKLNALYSNAKKNDYSTRSVTRLAPSMTLCGLAFGYLKSRAKNFITEENSLVLINDRELPEAFYINFSVTSRVIHILLSLLIYFLTKKRQTGELKNAG